MAEPEVALDRAKLFGRLTALEVLIGFLFVAQKDRAKRFDGADKIIREMWEKTIAACSPDIAPAELEFIHRTFEEAHDSVANIRHIVG